MQALELIPQLAKEFNAVFGRDSGGLIHTYCADDAETIVIAMGSVLGTIKDTVDEMRKPENGGHKIGVLGITTFRPFPLEAVAKALKTCKRFVVLEKSLAVGIGGIVATNVRMAVTGMGLKGYTVVAGLGGRAITMKSLTGLFEKAGRDELELLTFLDLDWKAVNKQLERERSTRRSGPAAEAMLRDLGTVASKIA
jgi:pyruvate ferredoxin oxidoreductase alpha subunit